MQKTKEKKKTVSIDDVIKETVIVVASKSRPEVFKKGAWQLLKYSRIPKIFYIEYQEAGLYGQHFQDAKGTTAAFMKLVPLHNRGLGHTYRIVKEDITQQKFKYVVVVPDSLEGFSDMGDDKKGPEITQIFEDRIVEAISSFKNSDVGMVNFVSEKHKGLSDCYIVPVEYWAVDSEISINHSDLVAHKVELENKQVYLDGSMMSLKSDEQNDFMLKRTKEQQLESEERLLPKLKAQL